jgi:trimeric autotransporter adhesin
MLGRDCLKVLGLVCLVLPFSGCNATGIDAITVSPTVTDFEGAAGTVQLTAIATIGHGPGHPATYKNVTNEVTWSTPLTQVASVNTTGFVTIVGLGLTQINATVNGFTGVVSGNATVCAEVPGSTTTITCPSVGGAERPRTRLSMVRGERAVGMPGDVLQFRVNGTFGDNDAQEDMTDSVKWTSSDESVATVSSSGLVTGVGRGRATIMAILTNPDRTAVAAATTFTVKGSGR